MTYRSALSEVIPYMTQWAKRVSLPAPFEYFGRSDEMSKRVIGTNNVVGKTRAIQVYMGKALLAEWHWGPDLNRYVRV